MKIVAFADPYISADAIRDGLTTLTDSGMDLTVKTWPIETIEALQEINLEVEKHGPNGIDIPAELSEAAKEADILITQFTPIGADLINDCPNLKLIGVMRGGTENVDDDAAGQRNIPILNAPGRNARAVAEFAVGLILAETRNIARTHAAMKEGIWLKEFPNSSYVPEVENRQIGVVGAGAIGQLVMKFLHAMGAKCVYYDPYVTDCEYGTASESLEDLIETSDVITIHSRLSKATHHLISANLIKTMKPEAVVVNTARSGLIDESALLDALESKAIMGAAIDTFDDEPLPRDSRWLKLDNVTLTSHLAGTTEDAFLKSPKILAARILDHVNEGGVNGS